MEKTLVKHCNKPQSNINIRVYVCVILSLTKLCIYEGGITRFKAPTPQLLTSYTLCAEEAFNTLRWETYRRLQLDFSFHYNK